VVHHQEVHIPAHPQVGAYHNQLQGEVVGMEVEAMISLLVQDHVEVDLSHLRLLLHHDLQLVDDWEYRKKLLYGVLDHSLRHR
jgi:hypothetical protein